MVCASRWCATGPETALPKELAQLREDTINRWLDGNFKTPVGKEIGHRAKSGPDLKTAVANLSSVLSATWRSQTAWVSQAVSFVNYVPGAGAAARVTSKGIQKSGRLAGKALFNTAKILAIAATGRA